MLVVDILVNWNQEKRLKAMKMKLHEKLFFAVGIVSL